MTLSNFCKSFADFEIGLLCRADSEDFMTKENADVICVLIGSAKEGFSNAVSEDSVTDSKKRKKQSIAMTTCEDQVAKKQKKKKVPNILHYFIFYVISIGYFLCYLFPHYCVSSVLVF